MGRGPSPAVFALRCRDLLLHFGDERFCHFNAVHDGADEADVCVDVGEGVGRERDDGAAGLEQCGERLHAIGHAGEDEIRLRGEDLIRGAGPRVFDDGDGALGQRGHGFHAIAGAGDERVERTETIEDDADAGLQGGDAQARVDAGDGHAMPSGRLRRWRRE